MYNLGSTLLCKKGISMKTILSGISQQSHDQEKKSHSYVAKNHVIQGLWLWNSLKGFSSWTMLIAYLFQIRCNY